MTTIRYSYTVITGITNPVFFLIKLTAPYWFHRVPYRVRIAIAGVCAALNFVLVMYGPSPAIQLIGVALAAVQGGIGEATCLAMSQFYHEPKRLIVMWSSGTGFAGPGGSCAATTAVIWPEWRPQRSGLNRSEI